MLVGMRAQLRDGGRAFVTVPRSCLDHSFTMSESSFADALAAVGLRPLSPADGAVAPPESTKIAYFECVAGAPVAAAALRVQRARHEARKSANARALPRKSAGASFDVDVGGYLGYGVRVPRSSVRHAPERARSSCCSPHTQHDAWARG
jgi:hypothetical protein